MGYAVYEDRDARGRGVERWAGYGVPAMCDRPECTTEIDRGLAYKCEEYISYDIDEDTEVETETEVEGCGLFFCGQHEDHGVHEGAVPKPDTPEWNGHLLSDDSWREWREKNPTRVALLTR